MSYWDSAYFRKRHDTTYSRDSPYEEKLREQREGINIATWEQLKPDSGITPVRSCPDHPGVPLVPKKNDSSSVVCRECGVWKLEKLNPNPPTAQQQKTQKVKQKQSSQQKTFIKQLPERKRKGGKLGNEDGIESLSNDEYDWIRNMWSGNIVEGSETDESKY